jgi:hypothetical protein
MSIHLYISVLLLTCTIILNVNSQNATHQYVIRKDFFSGIKAGEFTVYDTKEKHVYYRVESKYSILHNIKLIAYPSKKEIGRLQAKLKPFIYKGEFSILDSQTNQWVSGLIQENFQLFGGLCNIDWNGHRITMENEVPSFTSKFRDINGQLLAQFRIRPASILWTNKYDMQIFSNKYPKEIYLLALAVRDRINTSKKNG